MKFELFDSSLVEKVVRQYRETFPEKPTKNEQIYIDENAMMWDGYIKPVEELNELLSTLFRFSQYKEPTDILLAQEPGGTDNLSIQQLAFLVADILTHEKHHQGLFASMLKNGVIARIVDRLEVLLEYGLPVREAENP